MLAAVAVPLAEAGVCILTISTFDTDYILVREAELERAVGALSRHGLTLGPWRG